MEKLDEVIAGLTGCIVGNCSNCEYTSDDGCGRDDLMIDALEVIGALRVERDDLRKDVEVLTEDLTGAHDECHRLAKSLSIARLQRKQAWEKLARITGEKYAEWLSESGEPVPECPREGM